MHRIFRAFVDLMRDDGFLGFQNDRAFDIYRELGKGYSLNEKEPALVKRLCKITDRKSYGPISIRAEIIDGTDSFVCFNYRNKPVTRELGDMAVISIVSDGRQRLFQKLCLIQNKKGKSTAGTEKKKGKTRWDIDLEQLFLLKNFPKLSGKTGILKKCSDISFRNTEGSLGAFGLMHDPGEMVFIAAPLLTELMKGKKSLNISDISVTEDNSNASQQSGMGFPFFGHFHPEEFYMMFKELYHHYRGMWPFIGGANMPFLNNIPFARDIYDFVRAWTQVSIGETSFSFGEVTNSVVDGFSNALLRQIGFGEIVELPRDDYFAEFHLEGELGIEVTHIDVAKMK